ncbi:roadblock/LC7 domain-containing protein [Kitasatospora sp. NPDC057015]|uniref:roadblock/LC7 domain-containing protein n=1 Tax=Kitasatospora sp. NPDC057015 TaxID=3346001 RepID=UPI0036385A6A
MIGTVRPARGPDWLLDELVSRIPQVTHAVMLSGDGLAMGASTGLGREDGEQLAVVASGLHSLARGTGRHFEAGEVRRTMVELDHGFLCVAAAGESSCLAVLTSTEADLGLIAYEMGRLVRRFGEHLDAAPRGAVGG